MEFEDLAMTTRVLSPVIGVSSKDVEWIPVSYFSEQDALQEDIQANQIPEEQ